VEEQGIVREWAYTVSRIYLLATNRFEVRI